MMCNAHISRHASRHTPNWYSSLTSPHTSNSIDSYRKWFFFFPKEKRTDKSAVVQRYRTKIENEEDDVFCRLHLGGRRILILTLHCCCYCSYWLPIAVLSFNIVLLFHCSSMSLFTMLGTCILIWIPACGELSLIFLYLHLMHLAALPLQLG